MSFFVSLRPTPVFSTPFIENVYGKKLAFDDLQLVREVEMVAFPKTVFSLIRRCSDYILEVQTAEYRSSQPLFIDRRFGKIVKELPTQRVLKLPKKEIILSRLKRRVGIPYVWGGNFHQGIQEMLEWYPSSCKLTSFEQMHWSLKGVDCSGLLYEAVDGALPRNTSDLMTYGESVSIQGLSFQSIQEKVRSLDLILWKGHLVIALDSEQCIESKHEWGGVKCTPFIKRLQIESRVPHDDPALVSNDARYFLIRRVIF